MENKKERKEEIQSRREFFKKAVKGALPILGAIVLSNVPMSSNALQNESMNCNYNCTAWCADNCSGGCKGECTTACARTCSGYCNSSCSGTCRSMNSSY